MPFEYPAAQVGDRLLVTFVGKLFDQRIMSTFWYGISELVGVPTLEDVMDELEAVIKAGARLQADYLEACPPQYTLVETWIQPIRPTRYAKKTYTKNLIGTNPVDANTANISAVINRRGVAANRKSVSTLHVPMPTNANAVTNGEITANYKTALDAVAVEVATQITTATGYVLDPVIDNGPGAANFTAIGNAASQITVRVMRRRTKGVGI